MRTENIEVTMKMPLPIDKPDANGVMYSKEAFINAFKNAKDKPLEIINNDGSRTCVGFVENMEYIEDESGDYASVKCRLFHGGTCEEVDFKDGFVTSMKLSSVGISK